MERIHFREITSRFFLFCQKKLFVLQKENPLPRKTLEHGKRAHLENNCIVIISVTFGHFPSMKRSHILLDFSRFPPLLGCRSSRRRFRSSLERLLLRFRLRFLFPPPPCLMPSPEPPSPPSPMDSPESMRESASESSVMR